MAVGKLIGVLVLLHCSAGLMGAKVRSAIVGGKDAPKGSWPGLVYLDIVTDDGKKKWHCSGTILNEKWVLTAGRCWDDELKSRWDRTGVWIGTHALKMPSERYMSIDRIVRHKDFRFNDYVAYNDIALIMLNKSIEFSDTVTKVKLPKEDDTFDSSSECWIAGWGDNEKGQLPDPEILQQVKISILPQGSCNRTFPGINAKMLCAGDPAGGKDACKGDYGDPLMCRTTRGFVQVGIMSFGSSKGCGIKGHPSIYTRVSSYMDWINGYINMRTEESASA